MTTTTQPEVDYIFATPCPAWCKLAGRELHDLGEPHDGAHIRDHVGPLFGAFLGCGATESSAALGVLTHHVLLAVDHPTEVDGPSVLLDLASQSIAAAKWLEAHR